MVFECVPIVARKKKRKGGEKRVDEDKIKELLADLEDAIFGEEDEDEENEE